MTEEFIHSQVLKRFGPGNTVRVLCQTGNGREFHIIALEFREPNTVVLCELIDIEEQFNES